MIETTVGQVLINEALPEALRDYNRVLDSKALKQLLAQVGREYPEQYREVSHALNQVGRTASQAEGGMSFGLRHLRTSKAALEARRRIQADLDRILADPRLSDKTREELVIRATGRESEALQKAVYQEALKDKNPLAMQVMSGARGKPVNLSSLLSSDMLYSDHRDAVIPVPVLRSYSEGLSPEEYWAGTYGARRGIIATKFATADAGFLSKQLNQANHRLLIAGLDRDDADTDTTVRGMPVDTDDMDNEGALLAADTGPFKKNTPLTPKIMKYLSRLGKKRILVRSPIVGGDISGGVYARDVGLRETGQLPGRGEFVGLQAAQALSEPISQGQLSAKHSGGIAGAEKSVGGFQYINQLIQVPKVMRGGASHALRDGAVQHIEEAPRRRLPCDGRWRVALCPRWPGVEGQERRHDRGW
jgi:DNA-directed RNA polymerase subunit beta'